MAKARNQAPWRIYFYVPNLIGYARILANILAFKVCFTEKRFFTALYFISFVCDELDGRFARLLNQASTFGAVLDMVTDRVSTAALLVVLSVLYRPCFMFFLGMLALDISSHWLQMYSSFLSNKTSHKDVTDNKSWLMRMYYKHRIFMGYCCVSTEVLYLVLYLMSQNESVSVVKVFIAALNEKSLLSCLGLAALPGWATKQIINLVQMKTAADTCVFYDIQRNKKP
eukprot:TRINITY_DN20806_c0_g1_i2.p1 TRINITY_DN20806_c0_g1~~TRINITY_DN20806_c0_g1_i2.p1  ORF type:complete len:227 (+),score=12.83 TRINITY_DN20806_c0_g1_i2:278-958(+)